MMTTSLFVIANVKQLRTGSSLEFYCLFSEHLGVLASYIQQSLTVFTIGLSSARFGGPSEFRVFEHSTPTPFATPLVVLPLVRR